MAKKYLCYGLLCMLGWGWVAAAPMGTEVVWAQQPPSSPPADNSQTEPLQELPLESLEGLSDEDLRDIYLNKPWLLPRDLTEADWERIHRVVYTQEG